MCYRNIQVIQSRHLVALWWIPTCGLPKKDHPVAREKRRVQTQHHNKIRQKKTLDLVISYNYLRYLNWMSQTLDLVVRTFLSISSSNVSFPSTAISSTHCLRPLATWPGRPRGPQRRTLLQRKKNFFDFVKPNFFRLPRVCGPVRASEDVKDVQNVQNSSTLFTFFMFRKVLCKKNARWKKMIASVALCPAPDWWNPQTDWPWQTLMALMAGSLKKKTGANGSYKLWMPPRTHKAFSCQFGSL